MNPKWTPQDQDGDVYKWTPKGQDRVKMIPQHMQHGPKMEIQDPKWNQNEPKMDPAGPRWGSKWPTRGSETDPDRSGGVFPHFRAKRVMVFGGKNGPKIHEKRDEKNIAF